MPQPDGDWHCHVCGTHYPVPSLALECRCQESDEDEQHDERTDPAR
jgi:predicted nucleic acid-binding Zn ribbon protein